MSVFFVEFLCNKILPKKKTQRARIKRTLDHIAEHDKNIKYDKYTGEIHYDGVKAPDSDVRELLSTLT